MIKKNLKIDLKLLSGKKYRKEDLLKFVFESKNSEEKNLATKYKKYLYLKTIPGDNF